MKNIHTLTTDKPSRLIKDIWKKTFSLVENFNTNHTDFKAHHIYITSDEEIKEGDWCLDKFNQRWKLEDKKLIAFDSKGIKRFSTDNILGHECKKIILTTDQDLIKDGVQSIDDEFLEWFVQNPSCEEIEVYKSGGHYDGAMEFYIDVFYSITIPKEERKKNFYCGDEVDYGDQCSEQCVQCVNATGVDYGYLPHEDPKPFKHEVKSIPKEEIIGKRLEKYSERFDNDKSPIGNPDTWGKRLVDETIEEAFDRINNSIDFTEFDFASFKLGVKWEQERNK